MKTRGINKGDRTIGLIDCGERQWINDKHDVEEQPELWLSQNPSIKVLRIPGPRRETRSLLTRIGG
jgi:hypothetical protein